MLTSSPKQGKVRQAVQALTFNSMPETQDKLVAFKPVNQKVKGNPLDPQGFGEVVKPGELIDIVELAPLTLADRRTYNLLLANAWDDIRQPIVHRIEKTRLKGSHYGNERLEETINRLMGTLAIATVVKNGRKRKMRVQLLGPNEEEEEEKGFLYYRFPEELVQLITDSDIYARLKSHVMFCFSSKYALCLYEMVEKRANLEFKQKEEFSLEEFRGLLNVPKGKLQRFADFNKYALKVAAEEINALCDFAVYLTPIKEGRKVAKIRLSWYPKTPEGKRDAMEEIERHRAGRRARIKGTVEQVQ